MEWSLSTSRLLAILVLSLCGGTADVSAQRVCDLDLTFLVDSSGSIRQADKYNTDGRKNWDIIKDYLVQFVDNLNDLSVGNGTTRVAAVRFSTKTHVEFGLNDYKDDPQGLTEAILGLKHDNHKTNTPAAFLTALEDVYQPEYGDRPNSPNVVIIITDGKPEVEPGVFYVNETVAASRRLQQEKGVTVFAVGVTSAASQFPISIETLREISSPPKRENETFWTSPDFASLMTVLSDLPKKACDVTDPPPATTQPVIVTTEPVTTEPPTVTTEAVTTEPPTVTTEAVTTEPPTVTTVTDPPIFDDSVDGQVDVVFVLDSSGSIGRGDFGYIQQFASSIILDLDVGRTVRVGTLYFSGQHQLLFHLNKSYQNSTGAAAAVESIPFLGNRTNVEAAIQFARTVMFTEANGDRLGVPNVIVFVSDGGSNVPDKRALLDDVIMAKQDGVHFVVVGVGGWIDRNELTAIASYPVETNLMIVEDPVDLVNYVDTVTDLLVENDCADNPCENGGSCADSVRGFWCYCVEGFVGQTCARGCRESSDVVFAVDASGSVGRENFLKQMAFVADVIENGFTVGDFGRAGVLAFSDTSKILFNLTNNVAEKMGLLSGLYTGGETNTTAALVDMRTMFEASDRPKIGVLVTDGKHTPDNAWLEAAENRARGIPLMVIGAEDADRKTLEGLATWPTVENTLIADSYDDLVDFSEDLLSAVCHDEPQCSGVTCQNGGKCVEVFNAYICQCQEGYSGTLCEKDCSAKIDLVIVLDSSKSMRSSRFRKAVNFLSSFLSELRMSADETRVALVTFSDAAKVEFSLDSTLDQQALAEHVRRRLKYSRGKSNMAEGLRVMREEAFSDARDDAAHICIVLSHFTSNVDVDQLLPEAVLARLDGVHIIGMGVGRGMDKLQLAGVASSPQSVFKVTSTAGLPGVMDDVLGATCDSSQECADDPCDNGGTCRERFQGYYCECQSGYAGINCQRECSLKKDVVFAVDVSEHTGTIADMITPFIREVVQGLPVGLDQTRVGILAFSKETTVMANLEDYQDKQELLNAVSFLRGSSRSNATKALDTVDDEMFRQDEGDRSDAPNVVVMVTGGRTHDDVIDRAQTLREGGLEVYVVGLGSNPELDVIKGIASDPKDTHYVILESEEEVQSTAAKLLSNVC